MQGLRGELAQSLHAFREVLRNRALRRLQLAFAGSELGDWAWVVALAVFAYDAGGAAAVGLVGLMRVLPAAVAAPASGVLADRFSRRGVMVTADVVRAATLGGAAAAAATDAPAGVVYAAAALVGLVSSTFRPAQAALLPELAETPEELTAANVATSTIESVTMFGGPALGGLLLAASSTSVVFAVSAGSFVWSAALVRGLPEIRAGVVHKVEPWRRALLGGFRTILGEPRVRLLVGLFAAQTLVNGALNVLVVVTALELLDLGQSGVGYLYAAVGVGGLLGAGASLTLVGRRRLAGVFGLAVLAWGAPLVLVAASRATALTLVLLAAIGLANTVVDVAGLTLLQRAVPASVLARVFGVFESIMLACVAAGSALAGLLVSAFGGPAALVVAGAFLPALVLVAWPRLAAVDAAAVPPERALELLRGVPFLTSLPQPTLEQLAGTLVEIRASAGEELVCAGERGERFYVIDAGEVDVTVDGRKTATEGPGDYFGEIALLRDVPRTATVVARTDVALYALGRDEFIAAVTGYAPSADAANAVVTARLRSVRPEIASL